MTTTEPLVLRTDRADGLTTLTLNRPGQFNSLSKDMLSALQAELDAIAASEAVRVVVIAGAGKAFCAGHDLKEMRGNHSKEFMQALFKQCGELMLSITKMPQPVIARVHGIATAAGCQLVSMGVPVVATRSRARRRTAARARSVPAFLMVCASSSTTVARSIFARASMSSWRTL